MISMGGLVLSALASLVALALWKLFPVVRRLYRSQLRNLPGPPNEHWFYGNLKAIHAEENSVPQERWAAEAGSHTIMYRGFLSVRGFPPARNQRSNLLSNVQTDRLWTLDTRALNHILTHSTDYQKPDAARKNLARILGEGKVTARDRSIAKY